MAATVIGTTASSSLAAFTSSGHSINKYGFLLRVDPAANSGDGVLLAFASDAEVFFPLTPGDAIRIAPEDAATSGCIYVQRSGANDVACTLLVSGAN
jgi:hypothetical protein